MALGSGVAWPSVAAGVTGLGMALLDPNLPAAVAEITPPAWRGTAIGISRFRRDLGNAAGAAGLGPAATPGGAAEAAFCSVAGAMAMSGSVLFALGEETHPRLDPALPDRAAAPRRRRLEARAPPA